MSFIRFFFSGVAMGTADIIPGVSGGTMAWILGVYARLIGLLKSIGLDWLRDLLRGRIRNAIITLDLGFILPLLAGLIVAVLFMVKVVDLPNLIRFHPEPVYGLFFGLILASSWMLVSRKGHSSRGTAWLALGVMLGFMVVNLVPADIPDNSLFFFLCGTLAISAMLLPGISGSFILLILGKYATILEAVGDGNFTILGPFIAGTVVGLGAFSRLLSYLLHRFHDAMIWTMSGLLIGTLWIIWPFQDRVYTTIRGKEKLLGSSPALPADWQANETLLAIGLMVVGFLLVVAIERYSNPPEYIEP